MTPVPSRYPRHVLTEGDPATVRPLVQSDLPALAAFVAALASVEPLAAIPAIPGRAERARPAALQAGRLHGFLAERGDAIVAACLLESCRQAGLAVRVRLLADTRTLTRGIGRALLQEATALARHAGMRTLVARMPRDRPAALALLRSHSFRNDDARGAYGTAPPLSAGHALLVLTHKVWR